MGISEELTPGSGHDTLMDKSKLTQAMPEDGDEASLPLALEADKEIEKEKKAPGFLDEGKGAFQRRPKPGPPARGKTKHLNLSLDRGTYIAFDIETTGGNPEKNGITEISALRYCDGKIIDTFYSMVNPGVPIPPIVRRMTGITNKMVRDAPPIKAVMPELIRFIADDVLVSHNTIGDMKFIRYFAETTCDHEVTNYYLCTHLLVEKLAHEAPDKSLRGLAEFFKLPGDAQLHRAEADAYLTLELFKVLLNRLEAKGVGSINDAIRFQADFESGTRLGWGIKPEALVELPEKTGVFYLSDFSGHVTFLSSAHNLAREVKRLQKLGALPKQLLRAVLAANNLRFVETPTAFAAALLEAKDMVEHGIRFDPANWHQRTANFISLCIDTDGYRLSTGPLAGGTVGLLGPIRGGKDISTLLDNFARILGRKPTKRGLRVEADEAPLLLEFFRRRRLEPTLKEKLLAFLPRFEGRFKSLQKIRNELNQISVPEDLFGAEAISGVLAVALDEHWHLYTVACGRVLGEVTVKGDLLQGLHAHGMNIKMFRQIKDAVKRHQEEAVPLTATEAILLNRMFWWAFFGSRHEAVKVIPVEELATL